MGMVQNQNADFIAQSTSNAALEWHDAAGVNIPQHPTSA
jgi:hypothetical protein